MSDRTLETLAWVLIYGGLLIVGLGFAVGERDTALRAWLLGIGTVAALAGVASIALRARRGDDHGRGRR